ncbi:MAG: hypothetical protein J6I64_06905 [Lachnospiraceae bacterium]|nr:hypothetical protein [Lachnospiraceae bacterium]
MTEQEREREQRKNRMRRRMMVGAQDEAEEYEEEASAEDDGYESRLFRHRIKKILLVVVPLIVLIGGAVILYHNYQQKQYIEYEVRWEKDLAEGGFSSYVTYGTNVIKYSRDGASYINDQGEAVWSEAYEMRNPMAVVSGNYAAIADREGRSIFIFDLNGCQGKVQTILPVTNVTVASQGVVAVLLEEAEVCYINFFDKTGAKLDIEKKMWMGGEGYPVAMALSPTGNQLMLSSVYVDAGSMQNKIAFLNFSEMGELLEEKLAGAFELKDTIAPQVTFFSDTRACAFLDNGITFYSMKELSPKDPLLPEQGQTYTYDEDIRSIFYDTTHVGIITDGKDQMTPYHLYVYDASGQVVLDMEMDFEYVKAQMSSYGICLNAQSECRLYSFDGQVKYDGSLDGSISMLVPLSQTRLIRIGDQKISEVVLK